MMIKKRKLTKIELIKLFAHLANSYGWSEDCMMDMSLQRLYSIIQLH
ncbi:hypothetical protein OFQ66_08600 [Brachyspira hyodysenteriae]|nr:hypothetical protein [Brachyspira hyodysenteriae]MCZ9892342.1 hypothetical protein [Brachyspira hyodysenteriae]MCZ9989889.1 hypothetical protein [Brachyspira hyodysenteriae]